MRKPFVLCATLALMLALFAGPAAGITHGQPDGDDHPHVGMVVFDVGGFPAFLCSGTLLSPTVLLTAGHCTFGTSGGRVWFESDGADAIGFPFGGGTSIEFAEIHTHPGFAPDVIGMHDGGIAILSEPVDSPRFGELPAMGVLDDLAVRRGPQSPQFTPVGYGVQSIVPEFQADMVRHRATVGLVSVNGTGEVPAGNSAMFTSNPGKKNTGGTCFGDSGGPVFVQDSDVIAAVTSFAQNENCVGVFGGYRTDTAAAQAFIGQFLD